MRKILLALPLASVLLLAGCDCNTCAIPADDCNTCVASAPQSGEYVTATVATKETTVEVATVKPQFKASPVEISPSPLIADAEETIETPAPATTATVAATTEKQPAESSMPRIPTMPLPEGWNYIGEKDLSGGAINTIAVDQYYTQIEKSSDVADI